MLAHGYRSCMTYTWLAFLRTSAVECAGVRQKKTGDTAVGRKRMNPEGKTDEMKTIRQDPVLLRLKDLLRRYDLHPRRRGMSLESRSMT